MRSTRPSLKDVARAAGVSPATVSLALRRVGRVKEATAERVRRVAEELGYSPDPALARLASKRFHRDSLAAGSPLVFLGQLSDGTFGTAHFAFRHFFDEVARRHGYLPICDAVAEVGEIPRKLREYRAKGALGFLLTLFDPALAEVDWSEFCVVSLGSRLDDRRFFQVRTDAAAAIAIATKRVLEAGYRRIGYALLRHRGVELFDDHLRYGMAASYQASGEVSDEVPILDVPVDGKREFQSWFLRHRPEAVIAFPQICHWYLEEIGVVPGRDVAYVQSAIQKPTPQFAGCWENPQRLTELAVESLDDRIRRGGRGLVERPRQVLVVPEWHDAASFPVG